MKKIEFPESDTDVVLDVVLGGDEKSGDRIQLTWFNSYNSLSLYLKPEELLTLASELITYYWSNKNARPS